MAATAATGNESRRSLAENWGPTLVRPTIFPVRLMAAIKLLNALFATENDGLRFSHLYAS